MPKNYCIMQIWAESGKSALPICNYSQILYQFLTFTQNLKRSRRNKRGLFLNFSGSFYFRHKLYVKNFHHQPHPAFQAFLKGGLFPGAAHRPLPVQTFTLFPSVNPQLLRVLAIRSWPADCYKLYSLISNGLIQFPL